MRRDEDLMSKRSDWLVGCSHDLDVAHAALNIIFEAIPLPLLTPRFQKICPNVIRELIRAVEKNLYVILSKRAR